jgi:hypothetical protein
VIQKCPTFVLKENRLEFNIMEKDGSSFVRSVSVRKLLLGRNTSRNVEGTKQSLDALRAEGYLVHGNPNVCAKSRYLLTNEDVIEVQGPQTSGEAEYVAIFTGGEIFVSVGSDHNDRTLYRLWTQALGKVGDTAKSKQMCPAVVASSAWRYADVKDHWDILNLKSFVTVGGAKIPFQDFRLTDLVDLEYHLRTNPSLREDGTVLFGGSSEMLPNVPSNIYKGQALLQGLIFPRDFAFELVDPVLQRKISHSYVIASLEEAGSLSL